MNNHGTYYYVQVAAIASFLNKTGIAKNTVEAFVQRPSTSTFIAPERSILSKIQPDGRQPFEVQRNNALDYSMFNLLGLFKLANIGNDLSVDLWNYKISNTPLLQRALDYMFPYFLNTHSWPYPQVSSINLNFASDLLCQAMAHYPRNGSVYSQTYNSLVTNVSFGGIDNLLLCTS
jgi:Alginate lyase